MGGRRAAGLIALAAWVSACATAPEPRPGACAALDAVLGPLAQAARDEGLDVEIAIRTDLRPAPGETARWADVRSFGFVPVWRDGATDDALRDVYWRTWSAMSPQERRDQRTADRRAWEAAYAEVGDDRIYGDDAVWRDFLAANRRAARWSCAARFAEAQGAALVSADAPRAETAVRFIPARPGFSEDRALISAWSVYLPFDDGVEREGGTLWLLRPSGEAWRVLSARRLDS